MRSPMRSPSIGAILDDLMQLHEGQNHRRPLRRANSSHPPAQRYKVNRAATVLSLIDELAFSGTETPEPANGPPSAQPQEERYKRTSVTF